MKTSHMPGPKKAASAKKKSSGQPTLFNERISADICAKVAAGTPLSRAIKSHGICEASLFNWRRRYPEFNRAILAAKARFFTEQSQTPVPAGC